jgi:hypothetical protein
MPLVSTGAAIAASSASSKWLTTAAIATIAAAGVTTAGTIQSGRAQAKMAEYNAQVAEREAAIAATGAEFEEAQFRRESKRLTATQRVRFAKSGVKPSGSPLLVMEDTAVETERNALAIRYGGSLEAARATSRASLERFGGRQAKKVSYYRAGGSLLTGASRAAGYYA